MTIQESLRQINLYPIPDVTILEICSNRGIDANAETTKETRGLRQFRLATADVYKWLAFVPSSISENGISFSISENDRKRFLDEANKIYEDLEENSKYGLSSIIDRSNLW